jgi:hypothetical protein
MSDNQSIADLLVMGDVNEFLTPPMYGPGSRHEEMERHRRLYPQELVFAKPGKKKQPITSEERKAILRAAEKEAGEKEAQVWSELRDPNSAYNQKINDPNSAYNQKIKGERARFATEYKESKKMARNHFRQIVIDEHYEATHEMLDDFKTGPAYFGIVEDPGCFKNPYPPGSAPSKEAIAANMTAKALLGISQKLRQRAAEVLWGEEFDGVIGNPWPEAYGADYEYKFRGLHSLHKRQRTE